MFFTLSVFWCRKNLKRSESNQWIQGIFFIEIHICTQIKAFQLKKDILLHRSSDDIYLKIVHFDTSKDKMQKKNPPKNRATNPQQLKLFFFFFRYWRRECIMWFRYRKHQNLIINQLEMNWNHVRLVRKMESLSTITIQLVLSIMWVFLSFLSKDFLFFWI